jgi:hypothetical protein
MIYVYFKYRYTFVSIVVFIYKLFQDIHAVVHYVCHTKVGEPGRFVPPIVSPLYPL